MEKNRIEEQGKKEFQVIEKIKEFLFSTHNDLDNLYEKNTEIKGEIQNIIFEILELAEAANIYTDKKEYLRIKEEKLVEIRAKISILDTLFLYVRKEKLITEERMVVILEELENINRLIIEWHKKIRRLIDEEYI